MRLLSDRIGNVTVCEAYLIHFVIATPLIDFWRRIFCNWIVSNLFAQVLVEQNAPRG